MNLETKKYFYFIGIGGIGMSALARYFKHAGKQVSGYDKTCTPLTVALEQEGILVHYEDNIRLVPENVKKEKSESLVVYTPAVPKELSEYIHFLSGGYDINKRSEVLGFITTGSHTIAVAGTHGKTTTSSMIAHLLKSSGTDCTAFLGGITQNYNTNLLLSDRPVTTVVEADEYDRSFLSLRPDIAVITSVDPDHLDIYGDEKEVIRSYSLFAGNVKKGGVLITKSRYREVLGFGGETVTYGVDDASNFIADSIEMKNGLYSYNISGSIYNLKNITLGIPGMHNVENSVAAVAVARTMGLSDEQIREGLRTFKGVNRRFDVRFVSEKVIYIDDYAHHPREITSFLSAVKQVYPGKKITAVFQPHLFTRTRDFMDGFSESLSLADELILLDIYPAREKPIPGITSEVLLGKIKLKNKKLSTKENLISEIAGRNPELLVTIGAGDIDAFVDPITDQLKKKSRTPC